MVCESTLKPVLCILQFRLYICIMVGRQWHMLAQQQVLLTAWGILDTERDVLNISNSSLIMSSDIQAGLAKFKQVELTKRLNYI